MGGQCHDGHCDSQSHSHKHGSCGHQQQECCDSSCKCSCHKECDDHCDFSKQLLQMADDAWMCVLKEKIREHVKASCDKHLDELAKIVAEANGGRWKRKLSGQKACDDFEEKVHNFFQRDAQC